MALPSPRKKTLLPLLLALALGAAACLACGSSESTPPAPDRQPDATLASGEETSSPTTTPTAPRPEEAPPPPPPPTAAPTVQAPAEEEAALATELTGIALEPIVEVFGEGARELTAHAFPLGIRDTEGVYWAVVTNGPQPFLREEDGNVINFFHIVALYRRNADASWSERLAELTLETAPHRTHTVEVLDPGPLTPGGDAALRAGEPPARALRARRSSLRRRS